MKVDIQFVHFPESAIARTLVSERITHCVEKFLHGPVASVKAFFSMNGIVHQVKIYVTSGKFKACVNAKSFDIPHSIEKVVSKLESSLRRFTTRKKNRKYEGHHLNKISHINKKKSHSKNTYNLSQEDQMNNYEDEYIESFDNFTKQG